MEYQQENQNIRKVEGYKAARFLPLFIIPLFFFLGWAARGMAEEPVQNQSRYTYEYGVGGGPMTGCVLPSPIKK
jgi:hypothetical protein